MFKYYFKLTFMTTLLNSSQIAYNTQIYIIIHKYILYYCILYLSTQTYSLAVRVYLPVQ